jgi:hypothetical protein
MANLRLRREPDREITDLPYLCMRCGKPAACVVNKLFFRSFWLRQRVAVPLCSLHRCYWMLGYIGFFVYLGILLPLMFYPNFTFLTLDKRVELQTWHSYALVVAMPCYLLLICVCRLREIRVIKIAETYIELTNVAPAFVAAVTREVDEIRQQLAQADGTRPDTKITGEERVVPATDDAVRKQ